VKNDMPQTKLHPEPLLHIGRIALGSGTPRWGAAVIFACPLLFGCFGLARDQLVSSDSAAAAPDSPARSEDAPYDAHEPTGDHPQSDAADEGLAPEAAQSSAGPASEASASADDPDDGPTSAESGTNPSTACCEGGLPGDIEETSDDAFEIDDGSDYGTPSPAAIECVGARYIILY
jgi:hypothetical protein